MLKIIHTADWHIGKNLHKVPMQDQLKLFFDWLVKTIIERDIDLLLVSGDIFDYANPAAEDRKLYFEFLKRLIDTETKIIITGGNHDSAGFLNAPRQLLKELDITVIGEATENIEDELVEVTNKEGEVELVVAAVPFLKDKDLRHRDKAHLFNNRTEEIRAGIADHYSKIAAICKDRYPDSVAIAMGHLYTVGADPSESERDIHMGNQAAVDSKVFSDIFKYVALGHIHRPQVIGKNPSIRYSGSPVALSFSEKADLKSIIYLQVDNGQISEPEIILVPKTRDLVRISGPLQVVSEKLAQYRPEFVLPSFLEIVVKEPVFSSTVLAEVEELKLKFQDHANFRIIKDRVEFEKGARDISELFQSGSSIEDLKPMEVFNRKLRSEDITGDTEETLKMAFIELLEEIENED